MLIPFVINQIIRRHKSKNFLPVNYINRLGNLRDDLYRIHIISELTRRIPQTGFSSVKDQSAATKKKDKAKISNRIIFIDASHGLST